MAQTISPFVLKNTELQLISVATLGTGTPQEFRCQLSQAQLTPSGGAAGGGGGGNDLTTFCNTYSGAAAAAATAATWTLDLAGFQAWIDATDLSLLLFKDEGKKYVFNLVPIGTDTHPSAVGTTNPIFSGEITMSPTQVGGTANEWATFTVSLPCTSKPALATSLALAGVVEGAPGYFLPVGTTAPASLTAIKAHAIIGDAAYVGQPAWAGTSYVTLADATHAQWDGAAWIAYTLPPVVPLAARGKQPANA